MPRNKLSKPWYTGACKNEEGNEQKGLQIIHSSSSIIIFTLRNMLSSLYILKPMLAIRHKINIYSYSAIPVTTRQSLVTKTIYIIECIKANPLSLYLAAFTLIHGHIYLFNMSKGLRIEKKIWILEKVGLDTVWEGKRLLTRYEEKDTWMKVDIQQYLGTDSIVSLFRELVLSKEPGKVLR